MTKSFVAAEPFQTTTDPSMKGHHQMLHIKSLQRDMIQDLMLLNIPVFGHTSIWTYLYWSAGEEVRYNLSVYVKHRSQRNHHKHNTYKCINICLLTDGYYE
jgi:hypothetical protein